MIDDYDEYSKILAGEHWDYIKSVLLQQLEISGKMYRDAMVHGFKHGVEYVEGLIIEKTTKE
jgi:hypothetical protein